jgi:hypothetical protein
LKRDYLRILEGTDGEVVRRKLKEFIKQGNVIEVVMLPE